MKLGVLGGTFDPIHYAHLIVAEWVGEELCLDRILFVPAAEPPHKDGVALSNASLRLGMVRLAVAENTNFEICDLEIQRGGISYTIDTVLALQERYSVTARELYFIMGSDNLGEIDSWHDPERLFRECRIVVVRRPGHEIEKAPKQFVRQITVVEAPLVDISASQIRDRVRRGKSIRYLVPRSVEQFIADQGLYSK